MLTPMITITCNCGSVSRNFRKMSTKDFPNGWETDCCVEKVEPEALEELSLKDVMESLPTTSELPEPDYEEIADQVAQMFESRKEPEEPVKEPKKRGRKAKPKT